MKLISRGHPRCRCLCFRSSFNFDIFRSNHIKICFAYFKEAICRI